jgi:RNA polymerase sigma factor (sigma-70 family)
VLGLLHAGKTYDSTKQIAFDSYARGFIRSTIFDSLRHLDSVENTVIPVPAAARRRRPARRTSAFAQHHESRKGLPDVAACPESQPDRICERDELRRTLARALERLPRSYQKVLVLHYDRDLTMKHISGLLGVSAGRISQIRRKALHKMSEQLQSAGFVPARRLYQTVHASVAKLSPDRHRRETRFHAAYDSGIPTARANRRQ